MGQNLSWLRSGWRLLGALVLLSLSSSACAGLISTPISTPIPAQLLPTFVVMTMQARGVVFPTLAPTPIPATPISLPSATPTLEIPKIAFITPTLNLLPEIPTLSGGPQIPQADIQIYRLGDLSKVVSPLHVRTFISPGYVGPLRVELYGEDGRLLVRQTKDLKPEPQAFADLTFDLDFEIAAAAEKGRLVIRTEDARGLPLAVNSVNLILLSLGENQINPTDSIYEKIVIQQPVRQALVQGGGLVVSGLARPNEDRPLHVLLLDKDGVTIGQRLVSVSIPPDHGWGPFAVQLPYSVTSLTPVRLVVFEEGAGLSDIAHLASIELSLSP